MVLNRFVFSAPIFYRVSLPFFFEAVKRQEEKKIATPAAAAMEILSNALFFFSLLRCVARLCVVICHYLLTIFAQDSAHPWANERGMSSPSCCFMLLLQYAWSLRPIHVTMNGKEPVPPVCCSVNLSLETISKQLGTLELEGFKSLKLQEELEALLESLITTKRLKFFLSLNLKWGSWSSRAPSPRA